MLGSLASLNERVGFSNAEETAERTSAHPARSGSSQRILRMREGVPRMLRAQDQDWFARRGRDSDPGPDGSVAAQPATAKSRAADRRTGTGAGRRGVGQDPGHRA